MKLFEKIREIMGFTPSERRVILLLIGAFLAGWGMKLYKQTHHRPPVFDYSSIDSEFAARTSAYTAAKIDSASRVRRDKRAESAERRSNPIVNINTASKDELIALPGIGEAMAERIILYREDHGPFGSVEELARVKGIGKKKVEHLIPYCTTGK